MGRHFWLMVFLAGVYGGVAAQSTAPAVETGVSQALAEYRHATLSNVAYSLHFTIPAQKADVVTATETIAFTLANATRPLQVDFKQEASQVLSLAVNKQPVAVSLVNEHIVIPARYLRKGSNLVTVAFVAGSQSLNRNNDYLYALLVPDRARTVYPCFDQPNLKAVFTLTLTAPAGWQALANAPLADTVTSGNITTWHFTPTDKMPTYLFSFTVGKYSVATSRNMQFLYRETDTSKIRLSIDSVFTAHSNAIAFLQGYTGIDYPFKKIGFAAIPSFQFGGMEHPGEVQYNASSLFLDEGATKDQLTGRTSLIAHETAHMWFGDMVTMNWFNDVWMKEVFANFMADKVTKKLMGTETFTLKFLLDHYPAAYSIDRTPGANPIRQPLDNLQEAGSLYGSIIYHKAPIMMRQLELLMGENNFKQGVRAYLHKYAYGNATWNDLIALLAQHTSANLTAWNRVWVNQPGRPVFSYTLHNGNLTITQRPEQPGATGTWPQQFAITLVYASGPKQANVNMQGQTVTLPNVGKPLQVLFNTNGMGYGLFPAVVSDSLYNLPGPLQRAAACINAYEAMLANRGINAVALLGFFTRGAALETNELNLRLLTGYISSIYWQFTPPAQRLQAAPALEAALWAALQQQAAANNKKLLFKTLQDVYVTAPTAQRMYTCWQLQQPPAGIKLAEDDYTALALTIALKNDTAASVLPAQLARITNQDRKDRLVFLQPALSPDSAVGDAFFASLQNPATRHKEAWVAAALGYMNHPLRQQTFVKHLPACLNMLQDVQRTGDVFFPQNWLNAIFSNYQSRAAWQVVADFLRTHPNYNPKLKAKILQSTDNLHRAWQMTEAVHGE
jgi:aminopeptidase N